MAAALGKPLILEEFGLARDGEGFLPAAAAGSAAATDGHRREFYAALLALVLASHRAGDGGGDGGDAGGGSDGGGGAPAAEISGVSFWAWAGEGRPRTPGGFWQLGDALLGDPPHERQGWYSVYDEDREMSQLITRTAARIHANASAFYYEG